LLLFSFPDEREKAIRLTAEGIPSPLALLNPDF